MSVKQINITMPKMDYQIITIGLKEDGELVQLSSTDLLFFTVRDQVYSTNYIFQKTLGEGIIYNSTTKKYEIAIDSSDTKDMDVDKKYGYDITIYYEGTKPKQKVIGEFVLGKKYTLNEVS